MQNDQTDVNQGQAVAERDEKIPVARRWLTVIDQHPGRYFVFFMLLYMAINNGINATSEWMETTRDGTPEFALWEPFVWEYSSLLANLIVLPFLLYFWTRNPLRFGQIKRQLAWHFILSLLFAIAHVALMVSMREGVYAFVGWNYEFGPVLREFFYEYRKDVWGYCFFLLLFTLYTVLLSRLRGEANLINSEEQEPQNHDQGAPEFLLVKKLDKEFLVKVEDIEWLEASGNYVNLHAGGRIYPLRGTLSQLTQKLDKQFTRVHRSHAINHSAIAHIHYQGSGDGELTTRSGQVLSLSRRYKDELKQKLSV